MTNIREMCVLSQAQPIASGNMLKRLGNFIEAKGHAPYLSISGHKSLDEVTRYTIAANCRELATQAEPHLQGGDKIEHKLSNRAQ
ncbi:hypothetical protein BJF95_12805 [Rhizobium oryziradicis]|uniref:Uncharacterized protein n=1 Tax=Rhizobium oryziradicis TaxID=1867956 RepID=A0A1Q8ZK99_9HYPH|nr:hypothetical protein BJF95_12805 [Rhizobium oryziradicis]